MIIVSIKTDQKTAEVGLFDSDEKLGYITWEAHRELSVTIHKKLEELLKSKGFAWDDIEGVIFYEGPGSFTGLRIGASIANALAATLDIPAAQASGDSWIEKAMTNLSNSLSNRLVDPLYGSLPHTTTPRK